MLEQLQKLIEEWKAGVVVLRNDNDVPGAESLEQCIADVGRVLASESPMVVEAAIRLRDNHGFWQYREASDQFSADVKLVTDFVASLVHDKTEAGQPGVSV